MMNCINKIINFKYVVNKLFRRWISLFGFSRIINFNNGTQYISDFMMQFCKTLKINQSFSGSYYHQGNGLVKRIFRKAKYRIVGDYTNINSYKIN